MTLKPCRVCLRFLSQWEIYVEMQLLIRVLIETLWPRNTVGHYHIPVFKFSLCGCRWKLKLVLLWTWWKKRSRWYYSCEIFQMISSHTCTSFPCRRMPSLLEYVSYNCNFMGILAGPLCSYKDYITFIEGRSYHMTQSGENGKEEVQNERTEPSPNVRPRDLSGALWKQVFIHLILKWWCFHVLNLPTSL